MTRPEILAEVQRREGGSWYDYRRTYRNGTLSRADYRGDPTHESSYAIFGLVVRYGDGFVVRLPQVLAAKGHPTNKEEHHADD